MRKTRHLNPRVELYNVFISKLGVKMRVGWGGVGGGGIETTERNGTTELAHSSFPLPFALLHSGALYLSMSRFVHRGSVFGMEWRD